MNTNSIEAISLSKQYPGFALEDVSFTLPQGCIMGFIGQNGAGKTTTIKRLLGLVQGGGEVHLLGEKEGYGLRKVKEQVGVFLEGSFFNEVIRVKDIDSILSRITPRWDKGYYSFLLDRFQIPRKKYLRELSKGMGTKLRLATILARHPKLLILDEPMSGLDPVARSQVMDLFLEFIRIGSTRCSSPPTSPPIWSRQPTISPSFMRGNWCFSRRRTGCWRNTVWPRERKKR